MTNDENQTRQLFWEIHTDIPREGPGCFEATQKAFFLLDNLPDNPKILDIGCGPGMQTLDLSRLTEGKIIAIDNHQCYLDRLKRKVIDSGLGERITVMYGDMFNLEFPEHTFDLIWAEGSIYIIGWERGLREWKRFLKPRGFLAATEITWIKPHPPLEIKNYWQENYPAMQELENNVKILEKTGYKPINHFVIPSSAWWADYYHPLENRLAMLSEKYKDNQKSLQVLAVEQEEIDFYRKYADYYGYVFYLAQVP
jgi:ubiquinone/menaquinone biosynthesis C-methylase UbiE